MSDPLQGVSVFVEAVEAGGFSAAAVKLHLSRSAVGKTVARLEERLGVRLFHRTTRAQSLTQDGQVFYERCLRAMNELRAGQALLESGKQEVSGRLRVSAPVLFGRRCVAPILRDLARAHPKLELDLSFNDRLVDLLEDGFDLAIRNGGTRGIVAGDGLTSRRVSFQRMSVCASPSYLRKHGTPRTLEALARHEALAYVRAGKTRTWLFPQEDGSNVEVVPRARLRFDDLEAIADAAVAGMGLAWLPCWLIRDDVRDKKLVRVLTGHPGLCFDVHALWPTTPHLPVRVRVAIDALAEGLPAFVK
ncbi:MULTISPECIES: LysR family transcriptional regulator [Corallococcus]|uniref:LysR family transcriptional regulator n=1 Tax=Corallococcus TaxID=83461 RepID=UPI00117EABE6|nr:MULTISPECIES: LysR family transcriptional regulator [Corallococcus]NBD12031.1 LysR family transcriptional regulator [Corallococcus silvisoli]TSC26030.1 LysR family transcriptional regulator [Corallococcus sp. Z5C101001]